MDDYRVRLEIFEGPVDLLLHLIKKNELDIYDIPIALITRQYLEYIDLMKDLSLDIAGEFLVMASTLTLIKSKMLLPVSETEEDEDEGEDPRAELVEKLLEYQKFKDLAQELQEKELLQREIFTREKATDKTAHTGDEIWIDATIFDLLNALKELLDVAPEDISKEIFVDEITVAEKVNFIMDRFEEQEFLSFESLFLDMTSRIEVIVTFLALLELMKMRMVKVQQTTHFGTIRIYRAA
jgi:segregation and condensation protein A